MPKSLHLVAPAKVNLFLGVGGIRSDGYHDVTTILHTLALADEVILEESDELAVTCEPSVGVPAEANIAFKAAIALAETTGRSLPARILVKKRVPHGAGLGGGSSDAAAVLLGLARLYGLDPKSAPVFAAARKVGADVAFFLHGGAALLRGRGDELVEALPPLSCPVALVRPPRPVSTADAYAAFDRDVVRAADEDPVRRALLDGDAARLASGLHNNMVAASCAVVPEVCEALAWVQERTGVLGATVAGSGSAVFALMDSYSNAQRLADDASTGGWWGMATHLSECGVHVRDEGTCE